MISMRSKITKQLLNYFFLNPEESLFVNEISRKLCLDKRNLVKKLKELQEEGILKSETRGNQKIYSINKEYPLYNEYKQIIFKTIGIEKELSNIVNMDKKEFEKRKKTKDPFLENIFQEKHIEAKL